MPESAHSAPVSLLEGFTASSVTVRAVDALLKVVPNAPALECASSLQAIAKTLPFESTAEGLAAADRRLRKPTVRRLLLAAKSMDAGDTTLALLTGLRAAIAAFMGHGQVCDEAQQEADAALKAVTIGFVLTRCSERSPEERLRLLETLPAGQALTLYYGTVELALPLSAPMLAEPDYLQRLIDRKSKANAGRLLGVLGREGVEDANQTLRGLLGILEAAARYTQPHAESITSSVLSLLPPATPAAVSEAIEDAVAAAADFVPAYRYLISRLIVEVALAESHEATFDARPPWVRAAPPSAPPPVRPGRFGSTVNPTPMPPHRIGEDG
jgi:hypothetical protein